MSFRFRDSTARELKRRTSDVERDAQAGGMQTRLVERYIVEGIRQDENPMIHFRDRPAGRRPTVVGTRLDVAQIVATIRLNNNSVEETAAYLEISVNQIEAAVRYYADYKSEIDAMIERSEEVAEHERDRWNRQQAALS